eukprot:TRINITY_DN2993_c0_g1_i1.p1 TRINITY_DN2993_c0_g1~~TRINITY_DN2993_c0_g1_i1.p1  ORF type:complete len:354 (+),score=64.48 TRINITY_DN2993_c0_g1_i1:36-1097(+)
MTWGGIRPKYCSMEEWNKVGTGIKPREHHCPACCFRCGEDHGGTGVLKGPVHTLRCKVETKGVTHSTLITLGQHDGKMMWPTIVGEVMFDRSVIDLPFKALESDRANSALSCQLIIQNAVSKAHATNLRIMTNTADPFKVPKRLLILFAIGDWSDMNEAQYIIQTAQHGGASVSDTDTDGSCALHYAASNPGFSAELVPLLSNSEVLDLRGPGGKSPLTLACEKGSVSVIARLLSLGASRDMTDQFQKTCLHFAAARGNDDVSELIPLLATPFNINYQTDKAWTALHCAAFSLSATGVKLLLAEGADPTLVTDSRLTALGLARTHLSSAGSLRSGKREIFYRVIRALDGATDN